MRKIAELLKYSIGLNMTPNKNLVVKVLYVMLISIYSRITSNQKNDFIKF